MCNTWQFPSKSSEEFDTEILMKLPGNMQRLNITGGEPMLREDIRNIVNILDTKTKRLEISSNGYFADKLVSIAKDFPNITIRVSVEGLPALNDKLRGIHNGFDHALRAILRLKELGIKDIGFAMTISGENCRDLMDIYNLASSLDVELANAVVHNSFYFHKNDNSITNMEEVEQTTIDFLTALLSSRRRRIKKRVKDWFRAYLNLGLLHHVQGNPRLIPCGAGTETFFLDPYGKIIACNGSKEPLYMGNLTKSTFDEIWNSKQAESVRNKVANCSRACWMTGTAVPAMRRKPWPPIRWVLKNKMHLAMGKDLCL